MVVVVVVVAVGGGGAGDDKASRDQSPLDSSHLKPITSTEANIRTPKLEQREMEKLPTNPCRWRKTTSEANEAVSDVNTPLDGCTYPG